jgi:hypothetical protein
MEVHALLRRTPILLAEQMLNEEMHDGQRRKHGGKTGEELKAEGK